MLAPLALKQFVTELLKERGLDFHGYKSTSLERRIRLRYQQLGIEDLAQYMEFIKSDPAEVNTLLNTVLINVTEFFRDAQAWDFLRAEALRPLFAAMRAGDTFRAWSAGCSNGEEPYSLAIAIAELLGDRLTEFHIKIYGTDIDEHSLSLARRGEYSAGQLRRVPQWLRERYFTSLSDGSFRIGHELRRLVIFGRSNILSDAPISHCQLVICRNLLIYLDNDAQKQIFRKLHYALDPGGFLFLGKAESRLRESKLFHSLHPRWRIFQKLGSIYKIRKDIKLMDGTGEIPEHSGSAERAQQELEEVRLRQRYLLETLKSGILVMSADDTITGGNEAVRAIWGIPLSRLAGQRIQATELAGLCPQIVQALNTLSNDAQEFHCGFEVGGEDRLIAVTLRPVLAEGGGTRSGSLLYAEDITYYKRLQSAVEQLEATSEELQAANEEMETTNEELQSTNEELETTNEELQSTNEELETTNEELQSVNEELENLNEELESRTAELNELASRYAQTLHRMPWPVMVIDKDEEVQIWNAAAQRMLGFRDESAVGIKIEQLPLQPTAMRSMLRRSRMAMINQKSYVLRAQSISAADQPTLYDIHFTPILQNGTRVEGVLILFGPIQSSRSKRERAKVTVESNSA